MRLGCLETLGTEPGLTVAHSLTRSIVDGEVSRWCDGMLGQGSQTIAARDKGPLPRMTESGEG